MSRPFVPFAAPHLIVLALTALVPLVLVLLTRRDRRFDRPARFALAALLAGGWIGWYLVFWARGWLTLGNALPLNLCDWASALLIAALIRPRQVPYELGYFMGLCGTLHGLITPAIRHDFPDPEFLFFFIGHGGVIAALLYLTLGTGLRPVPASLPRAIAVALFYMAVAGLFDWLLGVNYGLLRAKPDTASILDLLAPWPWYLPELVLIGLASILFYYAPFFLADRLAQRRVSAKTAQSLSPSSRRT